jgi:putative FmdB family regulatory protein
MPLYEYECEAENGRRFEIIQKFSDEILTVCPTCGGPVRKLISSPAIQFKGSGFYITDYARKSGTDAGKESKGSPTSSSSSDSNSGSSSSSNSSSAPGSSSSSSTPATGSTPTKKD